VGFWDSYVLRRFSQGPTGIFRLLGFSLLAGRLAQHDVHTNNNTTTKYDTLLLTDVCTGIPGRITHRPDVSTIRNLHGKRSSASNPVAAYGPET